MTLLDNINKVAFSSSIPTDLILGTFSGSFLAPPTATTTYPDKVTTTSIVATNIPEKTFFQGVFSVNNGVTWLDFNSNLVKNSGSFYNLQTQIAYGYSKPGSITIVADNWNQTANGTTYTASAYTFMYKVVLFAMPGQSNVTAQPVGQQQNFSSFYNYQKVFKDSIYNFNLPVGTSTSSITHNLGYIPKFRSYIDNFNYGGSPDNAGLFEFGYFVSQYTVFSVYMDTTKIYYYVNNQDVFAYTGTIYTRIYYGD